MSLTGTQSRTVSEIFVVFLIKDKGSGFMFGWLMSKIWSASRRWFDRAASGEEQP